MEIYCYRVIPTNYRSQRAIVEAGNLHYARQGYSRGVSCERMKVAKSISKTSTKYGSSAVLGINTQRGGKRIRSSGFYGHWVMGERSVMTPERLSPDMSSSSIAL